MSVSQIQNKFKAASCNVCIKDIDISIIGLRVHLKVTFSQQNTLWTYKKAVWDCQGGLIIKWNQPVSSLQKKLLEESVATTDFIKVGI